MKRFLLGLLILMLGLAIGGLGTWLYFKPSAVSLQPSAETKKEKKTLFYRAPMNPQQTSPTPMKDEMGMDYVPVHEEERAETETPGTVNITPEKIQKIGVKTEEARVRTLKRTIRTVGRVEHDESKVFVINTKVGGWVERLYVNRTDMMVHPGEKLLDIYSPELIATQEEYLLAFKNAKMVKDSPYPEVKKSAESLLQAARQKLKYLDITEDQIKRLEDSGEIRRTMTVYADVHGIVTEKMVTEGVKIEPGEMLFKIIDHSHVWVYGEIYEYELPFVKIGQKAKIIPSYTPAEIYTASINHIYTHFGTVRHEMESTMEESRTAKIRFAFPNPEHKLKLGMYVNVELAVDAAENAVTVPDSAVMDTGTRQVVIIDKGDGRFEPREVKVGAKGDNYYQIISGVKAGEKVVTSANFLIDSESSLRAAIQGMNPVRSQHVGGNKEATGAGTAGRETSNGVKGH
ncbi:MAG: efflux RND transporter periplasmic adaptor subunit [Deltaproteobacteria bacterium]|nr:efflux RND transporter periplasmic adaptor subunit [Deltaproteobacteria bacterium]